jgi:hypothetical protein
MMNDGSYTDVCHGNPAFPGLDLSWNTDEHGLLPSLSYLTK